MPFDVDAYRQRLEQSIATATGGVPSAPEIDPNIGGAPMSIGGQPPPGAQPGPAAQTMKMGTGGGIGGGMNAGPTPNQLRMGATPVKAKGAQSFRPSFDQEKVSQAKNLSEMIAAMKPKSQERYLDAWEAQYGNIQNKWASVQQELGQRPDPKRKVDRKEAFEMLMEFGLNLMQANAQGPDDGSNASRAAVATVRTQQGVRERDALRHDQLATQVRNDRDAELKSIGTLPQAIDKQSAIDLRDSQIEKNERGPQPRVPKVVNTDQGVFSMDETGATKPMTGIDGKPLTATKTRTGGGAARDTRPAEQKRYEHLVSLGVPKESARLIAYRQKSGDPAKDHADVYKTMLRSTFGDVEASKKAADGYIEQVYGPDALEKNSTPLINRPETPAPTRRVYDPKTKTFK